MNAALDQTPGHSPLGRLADAADAAAHVRDPAGPLGSGEPGVLISVVVPTFRRPRSLRRAIASVLTDLPSSVEVIVVNDDPDRPIEIASDDDCLADRRVRLLANSGAHGPSGARNFGARQARGAFLLFLDDDDWFINRYPRRLVDFLRTTPDAAWGFSHVVDVRDDAADPATLPVAEQTRFQRLGPESGSAALSGLGCGFWIDRRLFLDCGSLNERLRVNEDTEFCVRLLANGHSPFLHTAAGVAIESRDRKDGSEQQSVTASTGAAERAAIFGAILETHRDFLVRRPALRRHLEKRYVKMAARSSGFRAAFRADRVSPSPGLLLYWTLQRAAHRLRLAIRPERAIS